MISDLQFITDESFTIYWICWIKRPGVYYLKSKFIREGRLFESGRLLLHALHMRVVSIYDGS